MEKHFCMACGTEFESENKLVRYCPECQEKKKKEQKAKQKAYSKERNAKLGLTNVSIYKEEKEILSNMAKEQKITMAEVIRKILAKTAKKK